MRPPSRALAAVLLAALTVLTAGCAGSLRPGDPGNAHLPRPHLECGRTDQAAAVVPVIDDPSVLDVDPRHQMIGLPESVVIADWPTGRAPADGLAARSTAAAVMQVVSEGRRFRADQGLKPSQRVPARIVGPVDESAVRSLLRLDPPGDAFTVTATLTVSTTLRVEFDLSGAVDVAAERTRLGKDRAAAEKERDTNARKLANPAFTDKAPEAVVIKVRDRLAAAEADLERIDAALEALSRSSP